MKRAGAALRRLVVATVALATLAPGASATPAPALVGPAGPPFSAPITSPPAGPGGARASAPSISADAPATPIPVPEVAQRAEQGNMFLRAIQHTPEDASVGAIEAQLARADQWIDRRLVGSHETLASLPSATALENLTDLWRVMRSKLTTWNETLTARATLLYQQLQQLEGMAATWSATREAARHAAAPAPILQRIEATLIEIGAARSSVDRRLAQVFHLQDRIVGEIARCDGMLARLAAASNAVTGPLLSRDGSPMWSRERGTLWPDGTRERLLELLADMVDLSRDFLGGHVERVTLHMTLFVIVLLLAVRARASARRQTDRQPTEHAAAQVFELPISSAVVVALLATNWIYPQAPRLLKNVMGLLVLVPAVLIVRRLASPAVVPAVYALGAFFLVDRIREVCAAVPVLEQRVFLLEMLAGMAFLGLALRSERLVEKAPTDAGLIGRRGVKWILWGQMSLLGVAVVAGALGYMRLARLLGREVLGSSYVALVLYAGFQVANGLVAYVLRARPLGRSFIVRHHGPVLQRRTSVALRWLAVVTWAYITLDALALIDPLWATGVAVLEARYVRGSVSVSLGDATIFILTVGAGFAVSSIIRIVLHEDVYPRVWLPRGVPYALSAFIGYTAIVAGFLVAILALGVDVNRLTIVAGALGVGVGIGLQSAVANFVAGLILLLERRIHVGDVVQIGELHGEIREIGTRASTIRTWDGAEVIVPNASLTTERVTNWTLSDQLRRVTLPVAVAYTADPERVLEVLGDVVKAHPRALADPAPVVLCTGLGGSALNFEVRVWTARSDEAETLVSQLAVNVHAALTAAKVDLAVPQRDVHLRTE